MKCGSCCRQEELVVTVTADDIIQLVGGLRLTPTETLRSLDFYILDDGEPIPVGLKHIPQVATEGGMSFPALRKLEGGDCVFLLDDQCMIHLIRPAVCRSFPFVFKREAEGLSWGFNTMRAICPGIGKGRSIPGAELEQMGNYVLRAIEEHAEFVEDWNRTEAPTALAFIETTVERFR